MKALLLNAVLDGGGGTAINRLQGALECLDIECQTIVLEKKTWQSGSSQIKQSAWEYISFNRRKEVFEKHLDKSNNNAKMFFFDNSFFTDHIESILLCTRIRPNFIIAVWTTGLADSKTFFKLRKRLQVPVFWYMADMEPMTGGCHYVYNCVNYKNGCKKCKAVKSWMKLYPYIQCRRKNKYLSKADVVILASSSYMFEKSKESRALKGLRKHLVLRGMDGLVFNSDNRCTARKSLGIGDGQIVLFFGATSLTDERKGGTHLVKALHKVRELLDNSMLENVLVLYAGKDNSIGKEIELKSLYAGYMEKQEDLACLYKASNLFVCPTLQDSGPMMVSESILCGTPVIGYKTGVIMDVVKDGITGYCVDVGDVDSLADRIVDYIMLSNTDKEKMFFSCCEYGKSNLTYQAQAKRLLEVLKEEKVCG